MALGLQPHPVTRSEGGILQAADFRWQVCPTASETFRSLAALRDVALSH
jgi:hypothetical protein